MIKNIIRKNSFKQVDIIFFIKLGVETAAEEGIKNSIIRESMPIKIMPLKINATYFEKLPFIIFRFSLNAPNRLSVWFIARINGINMKIATKKVLKYNRVPITTE